MAEKKQPDLETSMQALETLVTKMESGALSLEDSLAAFEKGILLSRQCQRALESAEQKVRILMEKTDNASLVDFKEDKQTPKTRQEKPASSDGFDDEIPF